MGLCNFVVFEEFTCACLFTWIYLTNIKHQSWYKDTFFAVHLSEVHLHPSGVGRQGDRDKLSRHSHVKYCIFSNKCLYSTCNKHLPTNKHPTPRPQCQTSRPLVWGGPPLSSFTFLILYTPISVCLFTIMSAIPHSLMNLGRKDFPKVCRTINVSHFCYTWLQAF